MVVYFPYLACLTDGANESCQKVNFIWKVKSNFHILHGLRFLIKQLFGGFLFVFVCFCFVFSFNFTPSMFVRKKKMGEMFPLENQREKESLKVVVALNGLKGQFLHLFKTFTEHLSYVRHYS